MPKSIAAIVGHKDDSMTFKRDGEAFEPETMMATNAGLRFASIRA